MVQEPPARVTRTFEIDCISCDFTMVSPINKIFIAIHHPTIPWSCIYTCHPGENFQASLDGAIAYIRSIHIQMHFTEEKHADDPEKFNPFYSFYKNRVVH